MARIFQRNSKWWIDYSYGGRRYRRSLGTSSESLAKKKLAEKERE